MISKLRQIKSRSVSKEINNRRFYVGEVIIDGGEQTLKVLVLHTIKLVVQE